MWTRENMVFMKGWWLKFLLVLLGIFVVLSSLSTATETKVANATSKPYHGKASVLKRFQKVLSVGFHSKSKTSKSSAKLASLMSSRSTTESKNLKNFSLLKSASMKPPLKTIISDSNPLPTPQKPDSPCWDNEHAEAKKLQATLISSNSVYVVGVLDDAKFQLQLIEITDYGGDYTLYEKFYRREELDDLLYVLKDFCEASKCAIQPPYSKPKLLMIIVPEHVRGGTAEIWNPHWLLNAEALSWNLKVDHVRILNNFEAMSYYLSKVPHENLIALNNVEHAEDGPTACFGDRPDGFGGAFLVTKIGEHDNVFPSEPGRSGFVSRNKLEFELLEYMIDVYEVKRVTIGHVFSGRGLQFVYSFMKNKHANKASEEVENLLAQPGANKIEIITDHALEEPSKRDWLCEQALDLWISMYGSEVSNFALMSLPFGGLFINSQNKKALLNKQTLFMNNFQEKQNESLQSVPVFILDQDITLLAAKQISRAYFPEIISENEVDVGF